MADFDESLPSHSVFVPHANATTTSNGQFSVTQRNATRQDDQNEQTKPKKPFLKKGR